MTASEQSPAPNALGSLARVSIAELSPDLDQPENKSILAAVTLVWPYSSSHRSLSLLLAEPDFRLRRSQGQVKVTFHGHVAEKVAESHVGIGDSIRLGLDGSNLVSNEANHSAQQTPGKSIGWDVHFETGVCLEVLRPSQSSLIVNVEHATYATAPQKAELAPPATPTKVDIGSAHDFASNTGSWGSPAFLKPSRPSFGGTNRLAFDPFAEDDGFVPGKGRKKPRYSLQREDWRIVDEPDSSPEQEKALDWEQALEQELDQAELDFNSAGDELQNNPPDVSNPESKSEPQVPSPVFAKPSLELTGSILERRAEESNNAMIQEIRDAQVHLPTDTPKIRPIPSPGLPVPSPLVSDHVGLTDYFPSWTSSETQEIRSVATEVATPSVSFVETSEIETDPIASQQTELAEEDIDTVNTNVFGDVFSSRIETESYSDPHYLPEGQDERPADTFSTLITEQGFASNNDQFDNSSNSIQRAGEALQEEEEEALEAMEHLVPTQTGFEPESVGAATGEAESEDPQSLGEDIVDICEQDIGSDTVHVGPDVEADIEEDSESDLQSAEDTHLATEVDMDALHALQSMRDLREREYLERGGPSQKEIEGGHDVYDPSVVTGGPSRSRDETPSAKDDEMVDEEDRHITQPGDYYDSEDEYDEEASQYGQGEYGSDESDIDDSEQEDPTSSQPQPAQSQEVIVLDSDSDDDAASEPPRRPTVHPSEQDDRSSSRSGSPESAVASDNTDSAMDAELARPRDLNSENGDYSVSEDESHGDESEEDDGRGPSYDGSDDRVHDSDKDDESAADMSDEGQNELDIRANDSDKDDESTAAISDQGQNELDTRVHDSDKDDESAADMSDEGQNELDIRANDSDKDDESAAAISEQNEDERDSPYNDADASENAELAPSISQQDENEHMRDTDFMQSVNDERDQPVTKLESPNQDQSSNETNDTPMDYDQDLADNTVYPDNRTEQDTQPDATKFVPKFYSLDGAAESHIAPASAAEDDQADPVDKPPREMAPESTQETTTLGRASGSEFETTSAIDQDEVPVEPSIPLQPSPSSTSPMLGEDGAADPVGHAAGSEGDDNNASDARSAVELVQTIETPERPLTVPRVVISADSTRDPSAIVQPPTPGRDASGLHSKLSYFAPLATLVDHQDDLVNTISVVQAVSQATRPKPGSKDWFVSVDLTDPSMAGMTLNAQIFRRNKATIPNLSEGSAVLLRDFQVHSLEHKITLLSVEASAWAVFDGSGPDAEVNESDVEYGSEERAYASGLRRWYNEVGSASVADYMLQASIERDSIDRELSPPNSEVPSELGSPSSKRGSRRRRQSNRQVAIHELRDGTRYTEAGSPNSRNSSVHELRDGTLYANI
ncbi:unnamed protein product [Penicillium olsonii]|nr:unnamed protein product [Penicillium olsonii]